MSFGMKKKQKDCFKNFHFIVFLIEKPRIKLCIMDLLHELPFCDD